jgi:hypothetical protein
MRFQMFVVVFAVLGGCPANGPCEEAEGPIVADTQPACNHVGEDDEANFLDFAEEERVACEAALQRQCALPCAGSTSPETCLEQFGRRCAPLECDRRTVDKVREAALLWWCFSATAVCEGDSFTVRSLCLEVRN